MTSDDEAGPSGKRIKLETTDPVIDVRSINKLFPKIDNLEYFPLNVLLNIFTRLDYMDLYNLAEKSSRFESIAKIVLNERHEYFIVDEAQHKKKTYIEFFNRFGNEIKAIDARNTKKTGHWIISSLAKAKNLEKIILEGFALKNFFFCLNGKITHLILRRCSGPIKRFELSKFRNLKKLEMKKNDRSVISFNTLTDVVRNNPALESLILNEFDVPDHQLMALIGTNLNQLKEFECDFESIGKISGHIVDRFFNSLKHLESLAIQTFSWESWNLDNDLLRRFSSECKSIKHLKLYYIACAKLSAKLSDIVRSFENIECLALSFYDEDDEDDEDDFQDMMQTLVENLPFLRELDIGTEIDWSLVLVLLRKCPSLEKLTVAGDSEDDKLEMFVTSQFYHQFIDSIQKPNVKIEIKDDHRIIGSVTKNQVIWRNKLVYWVGYEPYPNSSGINLLDLATKPQDAANVHQPSPFDLILGYLDLKRLHLFSQTNQKCSQLVENHVKRHSQQQGIFTVNLSTDYDGLEMFAEHVTNLRANILHQGVRELRDLLKKFHNLNKLYIYTDTYVSPNELIVPQVRHLIYDGPYFDGYSDLYDLSGKCPDLEKLELKRKAFDHFKREGECLEFRKLKEFIHSGKEYKFYNP